MGYMNRFLKKKTAAAAGAAVLAAGLAAGLAGTANAADTPVVTQNGTYQFGTDAPSTGGFNVYTDRPVAHDDASESLGTDGVDLSSTGAGADAGIIFPLGRLDSLFDNGQYVPPVIKGNGLEGSYNLYIDTNSDGTYFGWKGTNSPYFDLNNDLQGDTKFSVAVGASSTSILGGYTNEGLLTGNAETFAPGTSYTLQEIKKFFADRTDGGTQNPMVWAWIGAGDKDGTTTANIESVNGTNLVNVADSAPEPSSSPTDSGSPSPTDSGSPSSSPSGSPSPSPSPSDSSSAAPVLVKLSHGGVTGLSNNRAVVTWQANPKAAGYLEVINGPRFDHRAGVVFEEKAGFTGLAAGHTYVDVITPVSANGTIIGPSGHVTFVTPHNK